MNTLLTRRSIRQFTNEPIDSTQQDLILKAAFSAPSAKNQQPWEFVVVKDAHRLAPFTPYRQPLQTAGLAIVVCVNHQQEAAFGYSIQDCAAASVNMLNMAHDLGLGGVWLGGYPRQERVEALKQLLVFPEGIEPLWVLAFGHPANEGKWIDKYKEEKIHDAQFKSLSD